MRHFHDRGRECDFAAAVARLSRPSTVADSELESSLMSDGGIRGYIAILASNEVAVCSPLDCLTVHGWGCRTYRCAQNRRSRLCRLKSLTVVMAFTVMGR